MLFCFVMRSSYFEENNIIMTSVKTNSLFQNLLNHYVYFPAKTPSRAIEQKFKRKQ
jgi:hypothetical protein